MIRYVANSRNLAALAVASSLISAACAPDATGDSATSATETRASALSSAVAGLIAKATLVRSTDFAGLSYAMESGLPENVLGGIGSGLTWAGGTTFLGVPNSGPNATTYTNGSLIDNTTSYIARFETLDLPLSPASSGPLPFVLTPTLLDTKLLYSATPLAYGNTPPLPSAVPPPNAADRFYFTGRSDNFGAGLSTNPDFARIDPEAIRVSPDGRSVYIADEYGPYIYQFDRATGRRTRAFQLPDTFAISNLSSVGATEISGNSSGRVTNKGAEGLAITPDGSALVVLLQSPLLQDGGDGGRANRIVTIDVASGATHEYVYDNRITIGTSSKNYNSSEIIALNSHQFLIDTRDGKGLGDGSVAVVKRLYAVDIAGAQEVPAGVQGELNLLPYAVPKQLFLDIAAALGANGVAATQVPAKIESLAFGQDVTIGGVVTHTLFVGNDNDFVPDVAGPSLWYVFGFTDADLAALGLSYTPQQVTERGPDLAMAKTASATTVVTGSSVGYTLTVSNNGLVPAGGVVVSDLLPVQLTVTACASSTGTCGTSGGGPTVSFASIAGTSTGSATLSATLSCSVADGTVVTNQAAAAFAGTDPTPADNASSATITAVNPAPVINNLAVDTPVLLPANKKMRTVKVGYTVSDNCPGTTCSLGVSSNEAGAKWQVVDTHTVLLEAARLSDGPGRLYTIKVTCNDSGGATSEKTVTVTVPAEK